METTLGISNRRDGIQGIVYSDAGRAEMPKGRVRHTPGGATAGGPRDRRRMLYREILEARARTPGGLPGGNWDQEGRAYWEETGFLCS